ncbi:MAG TPA: WXG100 family type VII secretion target [Ktedonobacteraceae bacterium]|nr:WXG100 family type VII secretion target [Ktedonobacteraceae bacterium]HEV2660147.1 WXG100 family type VII secretion target [Ktedonobacteraceae bacterium]
MATIHINTDLMRQLGQYFINLNDTIANNIQPQIQNVSGQLENDWQGQSRYRFDQLYQDWRTSTDRITQIGEDLGRHLQNTANQFEQADQSL